MSPAAWAALITFAIMLILCVFAYRIGVERGKDLAEHEAAALLREQTRRARRP